MWQCESKREKGKQRVYKSKKKEEVMNESERDRERKRQIEKRKDRILPSKMVSVELSQTAIVSSSKVLRF